jgi:hypothetical protein
VYIFRLLDGCACSVAFYVTKSHAICANSALNIHILEF